MCLCKTCNKFPRRVSVEMSRTVSFKKVPRWAAGKPGCICSSFPSLIQRGCHPVSTARLCPRMHTTLPTTPPSVCGGSAALRAIVFSHIVGHPVDFGSPALSQGLVKFLTELLQRLVVRFPQSQRVLRRRKTGRQQFSNKIHTGFTYITPDTTRTFLVILSPPHRQFMTFKTIHIFFSHLPPLYRSDRNEKSCRNTGGVSV